MATETPEWKARIRRLRIAAQAKVRQEGLRAEQVAVQSGAPLWAVWRIIRPPLGLGEWRRSGPKNWAPFELLEAWAGVPAHQGG